MQIGVQERPRAASSEKFSSPQEELAYLREQVKEKEHQLDVSNNQSAGDLTPCHRSQECLELPIVKDCAITIVKQTS